MRVIIMLFWRESLKYLVLSLLMSLLLFQPAWAADGGSGETYPLDEVLVDSVAGDGSAAAGYKVDSVKNFGFWGNKPQLNMPYTMFVVSEELMENMMITEPDHLARMIPWTGIDLSSMTNNSFFGARGFGNNSVYIEGLRLGTTNGVYLDDKASAEALSGFSGFMFGMGTGSTLNFNLKRPTAKHTNKITVTGRTQGSGKVHADLGGPLPFLNEKFGYRFNVSYQDGETNYENQNDRLVFVSSTFDFKPTDKLNFLLNFSYGERKIDGLLGQFNTWNAATTAKVPGPPSGSHIWTLKDSYNEYKDINITLGMDWQATDWLSVRAGYNYKHNESEYLRPAALDFLRDTNNNIYGLVLPLISASAPGYEAHSYGIYTTAKVETFGFKHTITLGTNGFRLTNKAGIFRNPVTGAEQNYAQYSTRHYYDMGDWKSINNTPMPDLMDSFTGNRRKVGRQENINIMLGDELQLTEQWSIFAGVNRSQIKTKNWNFTTRAVGGEYDKTAWTPTFSIMYKPVSNATIYATYIEALEQGAIVGLDYKNAGEVLKPMKSEQYEVGIKYEIPNGALLSLSLFQIDKALSYDDDPTIEYGTFVQDGRQVHRGVEVGVQGRVWDRLSLMGGFVYMDTEIKRTTAPTQGKSPSGVPNWIAKMFAELDVPYVENLALTGGAYYNGSTWRDTQNNHRRPGYAVYDLGARYKVDIADVETTFRLSVNNVTNERAWAYSYPYPSRSVVFSISASF